MLDYLGRVGRLQNFHKIRNLQDTTITATSNMGCVSLRTQARQRLFPELVRVLGEGRSDGGGNVPGFDCV